MELFSTVLFCFVVVCLVWFCLGFFVCLFVCFWVCLGFFCFCFVLFCFVLVFFFSCERHSELREEITTLRYQYRRKTLLRRMRLTTQWRAAFRVKSFKAAVVRGKLGEWGGGGHGGGRLEIRDHWWRSHVAEMLISWSGGWGGEVLFGDSLRRWRFYQLGN